MPRPRCLTCDNAEFVIEWRLIWKRRRPGQAPLECGRRLETAEEAPARIAELGKDDFSPDIVSSARPCPRCRPTVAEAQDKARQLMEPREAREAEPVVRDWKMAQAGDL